MAIVNERHNAAKPTQVDPKTGRPLPPQVPPRAASPSLDQAPDNTTGFFGSFFAPKNKKKMAAMESPPPQLKASGTLSEKEANEVEVISTAPVKNLGCAKADPVRTFDYIILWHHSAHHDRYGAQSNNVESSSVSINSVLCLQAIYRFC